MRTNISFLILTVFVASCNVQTEVAPERYRHCHKADIISPNQTVNNEASPLEVCFSENGENRQLRLYDEGSVKTEIVEPAPIHVRERVFICSNYFLLSDGTDAENVLGHSFDNAVYRISDGKK